MKNYFTLIIFCLIAFIAKAQDGLKVELKIENYYSDSLIVGYYFADRQLVHDTLVSEDQKHFEWSQDTLVDPGMYILVTLPEKQFIQFLMPEDDQHFKIELNGVNLKEIKYKGSDENELFMNYTDFLRDQNTKAEEIEVQIESYVTEGKDTKELEADLKLVDQEVSKYIDKTIQEHPASVTALVMNSNKRVDFPEFQGTEQEQQMKRYLHYKNHYLDHIDTNHPAILQMPFLDQRINYYIDKLTPQHPDSLIETVDYLLGKFESGSKAYKFYLSTFLNEYANSKIVGFDKIYVHLSDNYYGLSKSPWVKQETLTKIKDNAKSLKPVLLGEIAADLKLYKEDGSSFLISELEYDYLAVIFWAPDCGHCNKSMPDYVAFEEAFRDKGVKVLAVCSKLKDKTATCWEALEEKNMTHFINAADTNHRSRYKIKYNVRTTPKVFILDPDRKILMKNIGAEQLSEVMENIMEVDGHLDSVE